jgi:5'-nucleotidase (lipoprotein e(P4) family)
MNYHNNMDAVSWSRLSPEASAQYVQAYQFACLMLNERVKGVASPCVIMDIDETVLDNSLANVELIATGQTFVEKGNWKDWCEREEAGLLPGAKEFLDFAGTLKCSIFYATSRLHEDVRPLTANNLRKHNLPVVGGTDPTVTTLFMQGMPDFSDPASGKLYPLKTKYEQRTFIQDIRGRTPVMIAGDNLSDWLPEFGARDNIGMRYRQLCALRDRLRCGEFIMLPNPFYGSWQRTINKAGYPENGQGAVLSAVSDAEGPRVIPLRMNRPEC